MFCSKLLNLDQLRLWQCVREGWFCSRIQQWLSEIYPFRSSAGVVISHEHRSPRATLETMTSLHFAASLSVGYATCLLPIQIQDQGEIIDREAAYLWSTHDYDDGASLSIAILVGMTRFPTGCGHFPAFNANADVITLCVKERHYDLVRRS